MTYNSGLRKFGRPPANGDVKTGIARRKMYGSMSSLPSVSSIGMASLLSSDHVNCPYPRVSASVRQGQAARGGGGGAEQAARGEGGQDTHQAVPEAGEPRGDPGPECGPPLLGDADPARHSPGDRADQTGAAAGQAQQVSVPWSHMCHEVTIL